MVRAPRAAVVSAATRNIARKLAGGIYPCRTAYIADVNCVYIVGISIVFPCDINVFGALEKLIVWARFAKLTVKTYSAVIIGDDLELYEDAAPHAAGRIEIYPV